MKERAFLPLWRLHRQLGRLPGTRHRRSQGFHQNRKTTLRRHFAELCFKTEIDDAIREDGNQIATLSDCFAEASHKVKVCRNSNRQYRQQMQRPQLQIEERCERIGPPFGLGVLSV